MPSLVEQGLNRSAQFYLQQHKKEKFERVPVFECLEDRVEVTIFNEGTGYSGEEKYTISYEDFNRYLQEGIPKPQGDVTWDELATNGNKDNYTVHLSPHTVAWEKGRKFTTVEKIGGAGFPTIESIMYEGKHVPILTDYGTIYEVELEWDVDLLMDRIATLKEVRKFTGLFYPRRKETEYTRVPYLEKVLKKSLLEKPLDYRRYTDGETEKYIAHLGNYNHKKPFLDELKLSRREKRGIDWGKI